MISIALARVSGRSVLAPVLGLVLAMLIWGSSFVAMKMALSAYGPLQVIFGRMCVASLIFVLFKSRFGKIRYRQGDWKLLGFMALCEPCLYFAFESHALTFTSASQAAMVTALLPLLTALAARCVFSEALSCNSLVGFAVATAGVLWLTATGKPTQSAPNPVLGNVLEFLAMVCAAGYTLSSRHLSSRYSPFFLTAVQAFAGGFFFLPALYVSPAGVRAPLLSPATLSILYLGAVVNVVAYFLYNYALSKISATRVSPFVNLIPVFSVLLGWLLLGEQLTVWQSMAAVVILGGTFASQGGGSPEPAG